MKSITSTLLSTLTLSLMTLHGTQAFTFNSPARIITTSARQSMHKSTSTFSLNKSFYTSNASNSLHLSSSDENASPENKLPMLLDPGTKGGALFLSLVLFIIPFIVYNVATLGFGVDEVEAGRDIGVGFTVITSLAWASTYIFRVATKDMTYAKQLKDYENAVIAKRLEELDEDEVQALVEDIERDDF